MAQSYDSLKKMITPEMIAGASETLGEEQKNVGYATKTLLAALLGRMLKNGGTSNISDILQEAGKSDLISALGAVFQGHGIIDHMNLGERLKNALLENKGSAFISKVASSSGLAKESVNRLASWASAAIAAYMGNRMEKEHVSLATQLAELGKEREAIGADVSEDSARILGIAPAVGTRVASTVNKTPAEKRKGNGWIWLLVILILLLIIWLLWRSCGRNDRRDRMVAERVMVEPVPVAKAVRDSVTVALPSGKTIIGFRNGSEEAIVRFLNSDEYKNATAADLEKTWFEFDGIDFEHDSATILMAGSQRQVNNLIEILKEFPNARIRFGGFADKTGGNSVNMEISKERAGYIKQLFVAGGIDASRISTEGFGEEYATVPVNATNEQRAVDRDIAIRFVK